MSRGILTGIPMARGIMNIPMKNMSIPMKSMNIPMKAMSMSMVNLFTRWGRNPDIPIAMQQSPGRARNPAGLSM